MYDVYLPEASYDKQKNLIESQIKAIEDNRDMVSILMVQHYVPTWFISFWGHVMCDTDAEQEIRVQITVSDLFIWPNEDVILRAITFW